mgnify:CR=1 FL=1
MATAQHTYNTVALVICNTTGLPKIKFANNHARIVKLSKYNAIIQTIALPTQCTKAQCLQHIVATAQQNNIAQHYVALAQQQQETANVASVQQTVAATQQTVAATQQSNIITDVATIQQYATQKLILA